MINRLPATAPIASSLGYLSTLSCPKTLHYAQQRDRRFKKKEMCVCLCAFAQAFLIYWPTDLLRCVRLHAVRSTSLEHPGFASLGAHALKLLTFPNLFPSRLIVVKYWTQPPTLRRKCGRFGFDGLSLVCECHLPCCFKVELHYSHPSSTPEEEVT